MSAESLGEDIRWCANCGAITFANGWQYPKRSLESATRKKAAK